MRLMLESSVCVRVCVYVHGVLGILGLLGVLSVLGIRWIRALCARRHRLH